MVLSRGHGDFYHRYRPRTFDEIVGHKSVVKSLRKVATSKDVAQAYLFSGNSGCGKTTAARVLSSAINCEHLDGDNPCTVCPTCQSIIESRNSDIYEINAAEARGIDVIRELGRQASRYPVFSKNKVFILDEAHSLTKDAQQSLLKIMEEVPKNVFIILCSTEPSKIIATVRNRCQHFKFPSLSDSDILSLISGVWDLEGLPLLPNLQSILGKVVEYAEGSPRASLVGLQQIAQAAASMEGEALSIGDVAGLLEIVGEVEASVIDICRLLIRGGSWSDLMELLKSTSASPETIRMSVLGYFRSSLMKPHSFNEAEKFAEVMSTFIEPFYQVKPENNLVLALFKALKIMRGRR